MNLLTERDLALLSRLLRAEELACKKANVYANTLTDQALAEELGAVYRAHAGRFSALFTMLGGKE